MNIYYLMFFLPRTTKTEYDAACACRLRVVLVFPTKKSLTSSRGLDWVCDGGNNRLANLTAYAVRARVYRARRMNVAARARAHCENPTDHTAAGYATKIDTRTLYTGVVEKSFSLFLSMKTTSFRVFFTLVSTQSKLPPLPLSRVCKLTSCLV